jgi:hypothetical protein
MYRSLYQGMAPAGEWIQTRVATLVRGWLPDWEVSHGQIADLGNPSIQSRSWDLVIHRSIPESWGVPPPASPSGPWPLVPKELCCAVVDTKGRYNTPRDYAKKTVFNLDLTADLPQLEFLGPAIVPILFIVASTNSPDTVEAAGLDCDLRTFVIAKAIDGTAAVDWHLHPGRDSTPPLLAFRQALLDAAAAWDTRNTSEQPGEQDRSTVPTGARGRAPSVP